MIQIIRALPGQAETLRHIARASKQHWGYDRGYMQAWTHDQTLTADFIALHPVFYAAENDAIAGFYALEQTPQVCELKHLWVHPGFIGRGVGQSLFEHLMSQLQAAGIKTCKIVAEPHAEGFYLRMGALRIGQRPMPQLNQILPILELKL
jgi:GNAT superfamily N-acetyltransferase